MNVKYSNHCSCFQVPKFYLLLEPAFSFFFFLFSLQIEPYMWNTLVDMDYRAPPAITEFGTAE